ncbi:sugar phosphate isomerase/epimerase family protein [Ohessyouella blattaphilus]|uniref:Sugar phosphate isomerase/epimerase n=1 Tax=Ohessyouella blattaphilus TaxID=2949333 RepID=A0ABT1EFP1_9FIRM|nr:sugar phosphate isomerase/epimerase [Ohessyouella blattaphilus]MCP1109514.1 sugar phosphate isomerase/epimerase [Ohessyouella blattaphilus]MCR8562908.1 sugar phosphate isomerase/epimerase [Ohessyouella blattaphilus]MDL2250098.1 sugar phosphate isomerase/epimerase [Lachnospiraceae bacterium OttesenSCG-928-J05]
MSRIISATAPCSWGVWWADGTPSGTPYETFLDQAAAAGYQSLELGPDGYLPTDAGKLREELEARALSICAGTACYQFDQEASFATFRPRLEALCKRIKAFDAKYLVAMDESDVGLYSEKKEHFTAEQWHDFLEKIAQMGRFTREEYGIEVVYHPHIKSMIETEEEIIRLLEYTGLNLCFDTGHHAYVNGDGSRGEKSAVTFIRKHPKRIKYLHFKNVDYNILDKVRREHIDSDTAFDIDVMCDLAEGIIDYRELKSVLDEIGYEGVGVIEQDMPRATTEQAFAAAKRNQEYLRIIGMVD